MSKKLLLALLALTPLAMADQAMAMKTSATYKVRFDGDRVGTWKLRNKVTEGNGTCNYTVQWKSINSTPISRTRLCNISEYAAGDYFDCEVARKTFFDTVVTKGSGTCRGFDDAGQETNIVSLVAGEDAGGHLRGVVMSASIGDVQNLQID